MGGICLGFSVITHAATRQSWGTHERRPTPLLLLSAPQTRKAAPGRVAMACSVLFCSVLSSRMPSIRPRARWPEGWIPFLHPLELTSYHPSLPRHIIPRSAPSAWPAVLVDTARRKNCTATNSCAGDRGDDEQVGRKGKEGGREKKGGASVASEGSTWLVSGGARGSPEDWEEGDSRR